MRRTVFFFTFVDDFQIYSERNFVGAQSVDGGEQGDDGRFVVSGGARVKPPIVLVAAFLLWKGNQFAAGVDGIGAQGGDEGLSTSPFFGVDGLAVIVRIKNNGALGARGVEFAEDYRATTLCGGEQLDAEAARFEHLLDQVGVASDVGSVGGDVGDGEELHKFADDFDFVGLAVLTDGGGGGLAGVGVCLVHGEGWRTGTGGDRA